MHHRSFHGPRMRVARGEFDSVEAGRAGEAGLELTVAEYAERWQLAELGQLRERTAANYRSHLRLHLLPRFGDLQLPELCEDDVLTLIRELQEAGYSGWTIRTILTPLSRMFNHAIRHGVTANNPIACLDRRERPPVWDREQRILNSGEIAQLLAAAPTRYRTLLATAIFTGLRQGELLALTWRDVDVAAGVVEVRASLDRRGRRLKPKTRNAIRDVVLMPALGAQLHTHRLQSKFAAATDYVFASRVGTPLYWRNLSPRALQPALETAGLAPLRWHDLRHTFAALLINQGASIAFVSRQMGHGNAEITLRVYSHVFDAAAYAEQMRNALQTSFGNVL